jgi:tRNA pseudouridine38-40 synthase
MRIDMRYLLHLAYDGGSYSGWQRQINTENTVQERVEDAISRILKEKVSVVGCGRTDAGVHSSQYIAHIDVQSELPVDFIMICNHLLPENVSFFEIINVPDKWHSRYDAIGRKYDYFMHLDKDPFLSSRSAYYPLEGLNFDAMESAICMLIGKHDFGSLCLQPLKHNHTFCHIERANIKISKNGRRVHFEFVSDRFLRGMIRILVAKLIEVGTESIDVEKFEKYLQRKEVREHKNMAYPQGLYLSGIKYPGLSLKNRSDGFLQLKF